MMLFPPQTFPLLHAGSFPRAAVLQDNPAPEWLIFRGCNFFQGIYAYSDTGFSMCCRWTTCFTMVFSRGCMRISAPEPGASPLAPCSLAWCLHSSLSHCCQGFCRGGSVRAFCFLSSPCPCPPNCSSQVHKYFTSWLFYLRKHLIFHQVHLSQ